MSDFPGQGRARCGPAGWLRSASPHSGGRAPQHGAVRVARTRVFPHYPANNVRRVCNMHRVAGQRMTYTARAGYVGADRVQFETIYPAGMAVEVSIPIVVR